MKLTSIQRDQLKMKYGGRCAYCGCILGIKWHADHGSPVLREGQFHTQYDASSGREVTTYKQTGRLLKPENDRLDNYMPSCVRCNILKAGSDIEGFRATLSYFARSIPEIRTYSHVHHLIRFGKLHIDPTPVVFWFERYNAPE